MMWGFQNFEAPGRLFLWEFLQWVMAWFIIRFDFYRINLIGIELVLLI